MSIAKRVFLIGPMGAGKSAVGRQLAQHLYYDFVDTDHEIERNTGVDIPFIFEKEGESGFRARETHVFEDLSERKRIVIGTGGGCVVTPANRAIMADTGFVIYLKADIDQLHERVRHGATRPLLAGGDQRAILTRLMTERGPLYEQLADLTINTDDKKVYAVASYAHRQLQRLAD